jgi:predicted RNase H-like HicB family nuclease
VFTVVVEQDEDGLFVASCPALQGCYTQGKTYEGAMKNIRDAIRLTLRMMKESGDPLPQDLGAEKVVIMVAA